LLWIPGSLALLAPRNDSGAASWPSRWYLACLALWPPGDLHSFKTGTTSPVGGWTFQIDENPIGFSMMIFVKACFVVFGLAEILHAFDLVGDPFKAVQDALPFLSSDKSINR
jgi:hypothetical protein